MFSSAILSLAFVEWEVVMENVRAAVIFVVLWLTAQVLYLWLDFNSWVLVLLNLLAVSGFLLWSGRQQPEVQPQNESNTLANSAHHITEATSKMAIGAAEVSFYIDGLIKDIKHSGDDCSQIGDQIGAFLKRCLHIGPFGLGFFFGGRHAVDAAGRQRKRARGRCMAARSSGGSCYQTPTLCTEGRGLTAPA